MLTGVGSASVAGVASGTAVGGSSIRLPAAAVKFTSYQPVQADRQRSSRYPQKVCKQSGGVLSL